MTRFFSRLLGAWFAVALILTAFPALSQSAFPPAPKVLLAVNPLTNKVYVVNEFANSVTVIDAAADTTKTIPVGTRPQFIAVNPATNRVYVNNAGNSSITVIDGATDTNLTPTPLGLGSLGPMAVNPVTNIVYIVRLTGTGTDEVSYLDATNHRWYTIATRSYQPISIAINPVTNTLYAAHYATGDVRIIDGTYNENNDHPESISVGVWSKPFAIAVNPVTNKVFGITEDSRGPVFILDGATRSASNPTLPAGSGVAPKGLGVNVVTNKAYAVFQGEILVIDGATSSVTSIPAATGSGAAGVAVDSTHNKVYVATNAGTLLVLDGASNTLTTRVIPAQASTVGVNPLTREVFVHGGSGTTVVAGDAGSGNVPLTTTITPLAGNTSASGDVTLTMNASSGFSPSAMAVRKVYYQLGSREGAWTAASGTGPFTATFSGLAPGTHTVHAFAVDGQDAPLSSGPQSAALVGSVASYTFTVGSPPVASVNLAVSSATSRFGQPVTFTASVAGSSGTPTGTVQFRDGANPITGCSSVSLASGSAQCVTSQLSAGAHSVTAVYSGNGSYAGATSAAVTHTVTQPGMSLAPATLDFGGQSMGTTGPPRSVVLRNTGTATLNVSKVEANGDFLIASPCSALEPGSECTIQLSWTMPASNAPLNASVDVSAQLTVTSDAPGGPHVVQLVGKAEKSLVSHYYGSILGRPAEDAGKAYWHSQASQLAAIGADVNEAWFALATTFFTSQEYRNRNRTEAAYVQDLYRTFFNRDPESAGLDYWQGLLAQGLPREAALASFLLSTEYAQFAQRLFGAGSVRIESKTVSDFYRGLLGRLPDQAGFEYWVGRFRTAQCQGAAAVAAEAEAVSAAFLNGSEYGNRARSNSQFVSDLYNAFMRRGADLEGIRYWESELANSRRTREQVRQFFVASPEFQARISAMVEQGCDK